MKTLTQRLLLWPSLIISFSAFASEPRSPPVGIYLSPSSCSGEYFNEEAKKKCEGMRIYNVISIHKFPGGEYSVSIMSYSPALLAPLGEADMVVYSCGFGGYAHNTNGDLVLYSDDIDDKDGKLFPISGVKITHDDKLIRVEVDYSKFKDSQIYCGLYASLSDLTFRIDDLATVNANGDCILKSAIIHCITEYNP